MARDKHLQRFIEHSLENGNTDASKFFAEDPTTLGFNLMFSYDETSPLFNDTEKGESAVKYLKAIGEEKAAEELTEFRERMRVLTFDYPYFFQTITGLENIYAREGGVAYEEKEVTITTMESIDLRIASLVELYMHAVFDHEYMRWRIPENMRWFRLTILVSEIRGFRTFVRDGRASLSKTEEQNSPIPFKEKLANKAMSKLGVEEPVANYEYGASSTFKTINNQLGTFIFQFDNCEFLFGASHTFLGSLMNTQPESATNAFMIRLGKKKFLSKNIGLFNICSYDDDLTASETTWKSTTSGGSPTANGAVSGSNYDNSFESKDLGDVYTVPRSYFDVRLYKQISGGDSKVGKIGAAFANAAMKEAKNAAGILAKSVWDVVDSNIKKVEWGNVVFRKGLGTAELVGLVTGDTSLEDMNPLAGRFGDFSLKTGKIINKVNKTATGIDKNEWILNELKKVFSKGNMEKEGIKQMTVGEMLDLIIKGNLGNVLTGKPGVEVKDLGKLGLGGRDSTT
jgi:hypothetical protein